MPYNTKQMLMAGLSGELHECEGDLQAQKNLLLLRHGKSVVHTTIFGYYSLLTEQLSYRTSRYTWPQRACAAYAVAAEQPMVHTGRQRLQQAYQPQTKADGPEHAQVTRINQATPYSSTK